MGLLKPLKRVTSFLDIVFKQSIHTNNKCMHYIISLFTKATPDNISIE